MSILCFRSALRPAAALRSFPECVASWRLVSRVVVVDTSRRGSGQLGSRGGAL